MARLSLVRPHALARGARGRELEAHFAARGWSGVRREVTLSGGLLDTRGARALKAALSGQGAVFEAFGQYLAWRADLFDLEVCAVLATISREVTPAPWAEVEEALATELGETWERQLSALTPAPRSCFGPWQVHDGELVGGEAVEVWVERPGLANALEQDLPLLPLLASGFPRESASPARLDLSELFADFESWLRRELDGRRRAESWLALASPSAGAFPVSLTALPPVVELSRERVVVFRRPPSSLGGESGLPGRALERARRLAQGWCELVFERGLVLFSAACSETEDGRLVLASGQLVALDSAEAGDLFEYAAATAAHDPEGAAAVLMRLAVARPGADPAELAKRARQLVAPGGSSLSTAHEGLAADWLAHGRLLRGCGFVPKQALADFYRGAFWLGLELAQLTSKAHGAAEREHHDALAEAVEDLSWRRGWASFSRWAKPREVAQTLESYATAMAVLPQRLERVLDQLGEGVRSAPAAQAQADQRTTVALALGLLMVGVVLVAGRLQVMLPEWSDLIEKLAALVFLGLGALWLRGLRLGRSSG